MVASEEMLERARAGDRASMEWVLRRYQPDVRRFARRACRTTEDAEDAVQHTLFQLSRGLGSLRSGVRLTTWLFAVVKNECSRMLARLYRQQAHVQHASGDGATATSLPESELRLILAHALTQLDPTLREVLLLRDVEQLSGPEVAAELEISLEAMKSRLHRARVQLRDELRARGIG
jgi:RNA polymerase sigma factor (sigma-70 family)